MIALGVDQASKSGWAVARGRHALKFGLATTHKQRKAACKLAVEMAGGPRNLIVMFEDHRKIQLGDRDQYNPETGEGPTRNAATPIYLGRSWGWWETLVWDLDVPDTHLYLVEPRTWRKLVGVTGKGTDEKKANSLPIASGFAGATITDHNVAEAVCIAVYGSIDGTARDEKRMRENRAARKGEKQLSTQQTIESLLAGMNTRTPEDVLAEMRAAGRKP